MCGLVAGIGERNLVPVLVEGLHRLEYRGYDSAGVAVVNDCGLSDLRAIGKVAALEQRIDAAGLEGPVGIAHTRWATHGAPTEENAHPHRSRDGRVAIVHNGIIENHGDLRSRLDAAGWPCVSATDSEVIAHRLEQALALGSSPLDAMRSACAELQGAYAIAAVFADFPDELIVARSGSPVLLGLGIGETFAASDVQALLPVTQRFVDLEDGDIARLTRDGVEIHDAAGERVERGIRESRCQASIADRGEYRHFMLKEIYEQPHALEETLSGRLGEAGILENILGPGSDERLADVAAVQIVACGTSYHAGMVAAHWIEEHLGLPARVEVASEYRYRRHVLAPGTLLVVISQSGETADTLAVLRQSQDEPFLARLAICNVPESTMARAADLVLMTHAGPEIGVASTKAFTTQLAALVALLGDSVTTDHISPAGSIAKDSPAGRYLESQGVKPADFNSYGSRRGNHEVMMRGTFANVRLRNLLAPGTQGGVTQHLPDGEQMSIYDAAMQYQAEDTPLIVIAGQEYGTGSSRDWAAKGTLLLGVKAVIVETFERIHRSNLVGMGVLPLQFLPGENAASHELTGRETYSITGVENGESREATVTAVADDGHRKTFAVRVRLDTPQEVDYFRHGGILPYVLRQLAASA